MRFQCKNIRLDEDGVSKALGRLEADVMEEIWKRGGATVRVVRDGLGVKRRYAFNTIMTVMNRLTDKKLLVKKTAGGTFVYRATVGREAFLREVAKSVVSAIVGDKTLFQTAAFTEAFKGCDEEDLALLKKIINDIS